MKLIRFKCLDFNVSFGWMGNCVYPALAFDWSDPCKTITFRTRKAETVVYLRLLSGQPGLVDWNSEHVIAFCRDYFPARYECHETDYGLWYERANLFGQHLSV
jgi:hypothetical protein